MTDKFMIAVAIVGISVTIVMSVGIAFGAITIDSSNRREYTWCPISDTTAKTNIEVDGCPVVRVYINDWNRLTILQQSSIDTQMRGLGFVDAGEHVIR